GTSVTTSFQDNGLSASTTYSYAVSAYDAAGNVSVQSSSVSAMTSATPTTTSSAPPPSVVINSPTNGSVLNGNINVVVSANSTVGIASITITGDGKPLTTCVDVRQCAAMWKKQQLNKGTHTVSGTAVDKNGKPANASVLFTLPR